LNNLLNNLIFKIINDSNNKDDIRFIYNRGNHEHQDIFYSDGMREEFTYKFSNSSIKYDYFKTLLNTFYNYCPVATILNYNSKKVFACHGGVPLNIGGDCTKATQNKKINMSKEFIDINEEIALQIMRNDFSNMNNTTTSIRDGHANKWCTIGTKNLDGFMKNNNINLIIRGHQDSFGNTVLFDVSGSYHNIVSNDINSDSTNINILLKDGKKPIKETDNSIKGPIAVFDLNKFNEQTKYKKVITISTNTGYDRPLTYDSYIVIE